MDERQAIAFDMYFASIASIQFHPAQMQQHGGEPYYSLAECAEMALEMVNIRTKIMEGLNNASS